MTRWRLAVATLLLAVVGVPAAMPYLDLLNRPAAWEVWGEAGRLLALAGNTARLVAGTLALSLPAGILAAVLLYRTDLPLRRALRFATVLSLFVPLPLFVSAWQAALGTGGWLPVAVWGNPLAAGPSVSPGAVWRPWAQGMAGAIGIHAVAGLPWVIVLVGQGLRWVERELEEDALTVMGPWRVLWTVTLPRSRAAIAAAGLWVALLTATEITVSDTLQVRTFAEEVYTQFVDRDVDALPRTVAASLPLVLFLAALVLVTAAGWERSLPPRETLATPPLVFRLGAGRPLVLAAMLLVVGLLAGVPVASLVWKAGLGGSPQAWSAGLALRHVAKAFRVRGVLVAESLTIALVAGGVAAGLGLMLCWLVVGSRWLRAGTLAAMALIWALPGPVLGIGLRETIDRLVDWSGPHSFVAEALYYGPSPLPVLWVDLIRFLPCAVAALWPVVRLVPRELREAAQLEGARPGQELGYVIFPLARPACLWAGIAVGVLALGELSTGKLVETPGSKTFAHEVFIQMHYGVTNDLAGLCLVLLLAVAAGGVLVALAGRRRLAEW